VTVEIIGLLSSMGFISVGPATTGAQAVRLARHAHPDLAILDIRMPDGDGLSAAKTLFEELLIPCIIVSAYSDAETIDHAKDAGVFGYLVKPPTSGQLRASIQVAWARYQQLIAERAAGTEAERQLEERKYIERAKWILVKKSGVDEPEAMRLLQKYARDHREKLIDVARRTIRTGIAPVARPDADPTG
jgi:response regulator NasT